VKRRDFITLLGGAAGWPIAARAQQAVAPTRRIGVLSALTEEAAKSRLDGFRQGLNGLGLSEGVNVRIDFLSAPAGAEMAVVKAYALSQPDVILATGTALAMAAKEVSPAVPTVFVLGSDPVKFNLVASFNRPGGNITGVSTLQNLLLAKHVELLHETVPKAAVIGVLLNPANANAESDAKEAGAAASALGLHSEVLHAGTSEKIKEALAAFAQRKINSLVIGPDPIFSTEYSLIADLAAQYSIATITDFSEFTRAGGLMSYGTLGVKESYRLAGIYAGRILKGEKPADLPVIQATKFQFVINLKVAKVLGITFPLTLLGRADEVIE